MTSEAAQHSRQLVPSGKLEFVDQAVTLAAPDLARSMHCMVEPQQRVWHLQPPHLVAIGRLVTDVAEATAADEFRRIARDCTKVAMVALVARVAPLRIRNQSVRASLAALRGSMALRAGHPELADVEPVVEPNGDALGRKQHRRRPPISWSATRRTNVLRHLRPTRQRGKPVRCAQRRGRLAAGGLAGCNRCRRTLRLGDGVRGADDRRDRASQHQSPGSAVA